MAKPRKPKRTPAPEFEAPEVRAAVDALLAEPGYPSLARLLSAVRAGHLIVDVTGSTSVEDARVRTIASTDGARVLPVFTAMRRLREALPRQQLPIAKGAVLTGTDALEFVRSADCVAVQFDSGADALVVRRVFVEEALGDADPTAEALEALASEA